MSKYFKPKIEQPAAVKEVELTQVQARGRTGRTILAGKNKTQTQTQKKSILGG